MLSRHTTNMPADENLRNRKRQKKEFDDALARTKARLANMDVDKAVSKRRKDFAAMQDFGSAANYGDVDEEPFTWPFFLGIFLLLLISGFLGVAFFAPHWLESEPSDPYDEDY